MPALPPVADVLRLELQWAVEGDPSAVTILHWRYSGGAPTSGDLDDLCSGMTASVTAHLLALMTADKSFLEARATDLSSPMGNTGIHSDPQVGTRTGSRLSPATSAVMNYGVHRRYRGGRPRSYLPFGAGADVNASGLWTDAFVTEYEGAMQTTLATTDDNDYGALHTVHQCQVSYFGPPNRVVTSPTTGRAKTISTLRTAPGGTGSILVDTITTRTGTKFIGSQRRRNRAA